MRRVAGEVIDTSLSSLTGTPTVAPLTTCTPLTANRAPAVADGVKIILSPLPLHSTA